MPAIAALIGLGACGGVDDGTPSGVLVIPDIEWRLAFEDNFDGDSLDLSKWNVDEGNGCPDLCGWGNAEQQVYSPDNITVANGVLTITGREEADGTFTSGRINTRGKFDFRYGRIEVRAKLPGGQGAWPAVWLLNTDEAYGPWPASGEIDIVEGFNLGVDGNQKTQSTAHYGLPTPPFSGTSSQFEHTSSPSDAFVDYALEWERDKLRFFVNGEHFQTQNAQNWYTYYPADEDDLYYEYGAYRIGRRDSPFDQFFHLIINFAIGGNPVGEPDAGAFPQTMEVEYVRVYECANANPETGRGCGTASASVVPLEDNDGGPLEDEVTAQPYREELVLYTDGPEVIEVNVSGTVYTNTLSVDGYQGPGATVINDPLFADPDDPTNTVWHFAVSGDVANAYITGQDLTDDPVLETGFDFSGNRKPGPGGDPVGELAFDMQVNSIDPGARILIKLDSGFEPAPPRIGEVVLPDSELLIGGWKTYSVKFDDLLENPAFVECCGGIGVELDDVLNPFVIEIQDGAADVYLDNIRVTNACKVVGACGADQKKTLPDVIVFDDAVNAALWPQGIRASSADNDWVDYTDGNTDLTVNWDVVAADDPARGDVIEVFFKDNTTAGVWFIANTTDRDPPNGELGVDLAQYSAGAVVFDIFVFDYGTNDAGMKFKIDTDFAAGGTSGEQDLGKVGDGEWQTVEIPVAQLARNPAFDLDNVTTGIVIWPASHLGGLTYQLDNIRWVAETDVSALEQMDLPVTFDDDFVDYQFVNFGGQVSELADDPTGAVNTVAAATKDGSQPWGGSVIGSEAGFANPVPFTATETSVSIDVFSPAAGIPILLKVEDSQDGNLFSQVATETTVANEWETLVWDFSLSGIDPAVVYDKMAIFFNFDGTNGGALDGTAYYDNVRFGDASGPREPVVVFDDAVDPIWDGGIRAANAPGWAAYSDGNTANTVNWELVDSGEPGQDVVIEVRFNDPEGDNFGTWFIQADTLVDLSAFADGELVFDVRVLDYAGAPGMIMQVGCVFPCTSGEQSIGRVGDGAWETVRIPISQLTTGSNLDLTIINTGLELFPAAPQHNVVYQVDNVRWE